MPIPGVATIRSDQRAGVEKLAADLARIRWGKRMTGGPSIQNYREAV